MNFVNLSNYENYIGKKSTRTGTTHTISIRTVLCESADSRGETVHILNTQTL